MTMTENWQACGAQLWPKPSGWTRSTAPTCNRPWGHLGNHFEADRHTFQKKAEWPVSGQGTLSGHEV
jgi:hypothetical protein